MMVHRRIALVYQQLNLGGRQKALLILAQGLMDRGWHVEMFTFMPGGLEAQFEAAGLRVNVLPAHTKLARVPLLARCFDRFRPTVVHTNLFSAGFWGRMAAKLARAPVIVHTEGGMLFSDKRWKRVPVERLLMSVSDEVVCVADAIKSHLVERGGLNPLQLEVIPNGISMKSFRQMPLRPTNDRPIIFSAGRLAPVKGYDLLVKAIAKIGNFSGCVRIAGTGPEAASLKRLAARLGVADKVEFLGFRDDVKMLLAEVDYYVAPSRSEGLSNSILEAMAAGIPVIATDVGGNRELLGTTGWVVPPEDSAAIASAIANAVANPDEARAHAKRARQRVVERYGLEHMIDAHEALYRRCLARKGFHAAA